MPSSRMGFQFRYSYERDIYEIYAKVSIGASGAPTLSKPNGKGIQSITRISAGKYTILLESSYNKLLDVSSISIAGASPQAAPICQLVSEAVATNAAPTVVLQYYAVDNTTATDPASGEVLLIRIAVRNASGTY